MRSLVEDIRDVRLHKVETNLEKFSATSAVKVCFLSPFMNLSAVITTNSYLQLCGIILIIILRERTRMNRSEKKEKV